MSSATKGVCCGRRYGRREWGRTGDDRVTDSRLEVYKVLSRHETKGNAHRRKSDWLPPVGRAGMEYTMKPPQSFDDFRCEKTVVEVRYPRAHAYWDVSGQCIEAIETRLPGVTCDKLETGFVFKGHRDSGLTTAVFFWDKVILTRDGAIHVKFSEVADEFWRIVAQSLRVERTSRVGHRFLFALAAESEADAEEWIDKRRIWTLHGGGELGEPCNAGTVLRTKLADRRARIEMSPATIREPGSTRFALMVDVDFSLLSAPTRAHLDLGGFMKTNLKLLKDSLSRLL